MTERRQFPKWPKWVELILNHFWYIAGILWVFAMLFRCAVRHMNIEAFTFGIIALVLYAKMWDAINEWEEDWSKHFEKEDDWEE